MGNVDPQELYARLVGDNPHPAKRKGLEIVHAVCKERFEAKATSWSVASIGRASEKRGGPTAASLRQPSLEHYRSLIAAWSAASQASHPHDKQKGAAASDDWIAGIDNLALRQMTYMLRNDLQIARAEIRRLQKLRPDGGLLKVSGVTQEGARSRVDPSPNEVRQVRRFIGQFIDNCELLRAKGFVLEGDTLVDADSGEVIIDRSVVALMRSIASLG